MRYLRPLSTAAMFVATGVGCAGASVDASAPTTEIAFPHRATRIDGVCSGAPVSDALGVTVEAPYANQGMRRFRLVNRSGSPHEVRARFVVADAGRCDGPFARSRRLGLDDATTCEPPGPRTLAPGESLELRIPPYKQKVDEGCAKIGLALHASVDGEPACVELGAWIAYRPGED